MRFAVLGLGSAGRRHAADLLELGHAVAAFDPADPSLARAPGLAGTEIAESPELAIEAAEAVVVASPSALHAQQATAALQAGRHLLVEKPLATTAQNARAIADLAERTGVVCGVAMNLRFHPAVMELRNLVRTGTLGEVYFAQASYGHDLRRWRPETDYRLSYSARSELGGGIVLDAIHELDYLLWLLGPVASVAATVSQVSDLEIDVEDTAAVAARFASGALATIDLNFVEPSYRRRALLVGSEAVAECDLVSGAVTVRDAGGESRVIEAGGDPRAAYRAELADFIAAIERGGQPRCPAGEGAAAVAFADAIKRSSAEGRRVALA